MTVKTALQISDASIKTFPSDMTRRRAVKKNLFGTTVDRDELRQQLKQLDDESNSTLQSYKCESVLGLIERSDKDNMSAKLKRLPYHEDSGSYGGSECGEDGADEASTSSSSSSSSSTHSPTPSSSNAPSCDKASKVLVNQQPLSKGQKTIKDYFPVSKRTRHNR